MRETIYNYKLGKGCGLIDETLTLISIYEKEMSKDDLYNYVLKVNALSKCTEQRSRDIVRQVFYPRFIKRNSRVPLWLKAIRNKGLSLSNLKQILMLYCARENAIMYDYLAQEFYELKKTGVNKLEPKHIRSFVDRVVNSGLAKWGESTCEHQVSSVRGVLSDFGIVDSKYTILPFDIANFTVLYLMHELHFEGLSDVAIWNHEDWQLFGLNKYQVRDLILEQNLKGGYIAQSTGDLMTISWNYKTMEEFIDGTL